MSIDLKKAHDKSSYHRKDLEQSAECGCFYCLNVFSPAEIREWIDRDETALCPKCGIDSVIGDFSGLPVTKDFLEQMKEVWFSIKK